MHVVLTLLFSTYHFRGVHNLYKAKLAKLSIGEQGKVGLFFFFRFSIFVFRFSLFGFVILFSLLIFAFHFSFFVFRFLTFKIGLSIVF